MERRQLGILFCFLVTCLRFIRHSSLLSRKGAVFRLTSEGRGGHERERKGNERGKEGREEGRKSRISVDFLNMLNALLGTGRHDFI